MRTRTVIAAAALIVVLAGCGDDVFDKYVNTTLDRTDIYSILNTLWINTPGDERADICQQWNTDEDAAVEAFEDGYGSILTDAEERAVRAHFDGNC